MDLYKERTKSAKIKGLKYKYLLCFVLFREKKTARIFSVYPYIRTDCTCTAYSLRIRTLPFFSIRFTYVHPVDWTRQCVKAPLEVQNIMNKRQVHLAVNGENSIVFFRKSAHPRKKNCPLAIFAIFTCQNLYFHGRCQCREYAGVHRNCNRVFTRFQ